MSKDPLVAIRDCVSEIEVLHEVAGRMMPDGFQKDPIARRAAPI